MVGQFTHKSIHSIASRQKKMFLVTVTGAIFTLGIAALLIASMGSPSNNALTNQSKTETGPGTFNLFTLEAPIKEGTKLEEASIKLKSVAWPRPQVPPDALDKKEDIFGKFAKFDLMPGVPLQKSMLSDVATNGALPVNAGMRALPLDLDPTAALEGYAVPGSRVDVILTRINEGGEPVSTVIAQNIKIIGMNGLNEKTRLSQVMRPSSKTRVVLEVSKADDLRISNALVKGAIRLSLRAEGDIKSVDQRELVGTDEGSSELGGKKEKCIKGKMKMGGKEFIITCEGAIEELTDFDS